MKPNRLIAACLVLIWASTLPFESEAASNPSAHLRRLAAREQAELEQRGLILSDAGLSAYLSKVTARLWQHVDSPLERPVVKVLLDADLDAHAYPDGSCCLTTGILDVVANEDQLAMILAHEIVHYVCQHASRIYAHLQKSDGRGGCDRQDLRRVVDAAEDQADTDGLAMMTRAGYCGRAVLPLMSNLEAASARRGASVETLHNMERRRARMAAVLNEAPPAPACTPTPPHGHGAFTDRITPALIANARIALRLGDWLQAERSITRFLSVRPECAEAHCIKGDILRSKTAGRENDRGVACYKKAIAIDPQFAMAHRALGELYYKAGRCQDAIYHFEAFIGMSPRDATIEYIKGYLNQCRQ